MNISFHTMTNSPFDILSLLIFLLSIGAMDRKYHITLKLPDIKRSPMLENSMAFTHP